MASMVREFARSAVRQLNRPRWNRLLLNSNINIHLPAIHQQRRFSCGSDEDQEEEEEKFCIDYKKDPTIEGHEPPDLPNLQPADPKRKIDKRRKFLEKKKCEEQAKQQDNEKEEEEDDEENCEEKDEENDEEKDEEKDEESDEENCDNFSRASFVWGRPKVYNSLLWLKVNNCLAQLSRLRLLDLNPVYLKQERTIYKKVESPESSPSSSSSSTKPVPARSKKNFQKRMDIKRNHFQAMKKKEALAKAIEKLKHGSRFNSQTKKDLEITQTNSEPSEEMQIVATPLASTKPQGATSNQVELKELLKIIKERCRKKCEEFERTREAESKRLAEEAALKKQAKMSQIRKLCKEAMAQNSDKMARLKTIYEEAILSQQSKEAEIRNQTKEITAAEKSKVTASSLEKEHSKED